MLPEHGRRIWPVTSKEIELLKLPFPGPRGRGPGDCVADGPGCFDYLLFDWARTKDFKMETSLPDGTSLRLLDQDLKFIATTSPVATRSSRGRAARPAPSESLIARQLPAGRYFLEIRSGRESPRR